MTKAKESNGVVVGDKIYLIGGFNDSPLSDLESFNLKTGEWKKEGDLFDVVDNPNPALTAQDSFIYIFDNNKLIVFNVISNILKEYKLNLPVKNARLHYYDNQLFVLGGYIKEEYSTTPSKEIYKIDLKELKNTKSKYKLLKIKTKTGIVIKKLELIK